MANFKSLIDKAIWKVARNLIRDYNELELLNSSSRATEHFVARSKIRAKEVFLQELEFFKFTSLQFIDSYEQLDKDGIHILICPIGGLHNLQRAFPFFASTIVQIERTGGNNTILSSVISFPALGQIFYADKGQGAWMEKYEDSGIAKGRRLRVSGVKSSAEALVSSKYASYNSNILFTRDFGSVEYEIASLASGKLDAIMVNSDDKINILSAEIFARESGGSIKILENRDLLVTNNLIS